MALPPRTPAASMSAGNARGATSFATKAKRALSQRPPVDLTLASLFEETELGLSETDDFGKMVGAVKYPCGGLPAPLGLRAHVHRTRRLLSAPSLTNQGRA